MANTDSPFGLRPIASRTPYSTRKVYAQSGYATNIFVGDAVTRAATATSNTSEIKTAVGTYGLGSLEEVIRVTPGANNPILGVVIGIDALYGVEDNYGKASTTRVLTIIDDPQAEFEIQADSTLAEESVGLNAVLIDTASGNTTYGLSGTELDTGTSTAPAADATYQLTIRRAVDRADNDTSLANAKWIVRINSHRNTHGAVGEA